MALLPPPPPPPLLLLLLQPCLYSTDVSHIATQFIAGKNHPAQSD
jgi:hypothetical protein